MVGITVAQAIAEKKRRAAARGLSEEEASSGNYLDKGKRIVAQLGRNVAAGVGDVADLPALPFELGRYGYKKARHALGHEEEEPEFGKWLPGLGEKIAHGIDVATKGYTKPRTHSERLAESLTRGVVGLPVGAGVGSIAAKIPLKALSMSGKGLHRISHPTLGNIAATAGGTGAAHEYQEQMEKPSALGSMLSGLGGSILGGATLPAARTAVNVLSRSPQNTVANRVGKAFKVEPELYERGIKLGLEPSIGMASSSPSAMGIELKLAKHPKTSGLFDKLHAQREAKLSKHLGIREENLEKAVEQPQHFLAKEGSEKYKEAKGAEFREKQEAYRPFLKELYESHHDIPIDDLLGRIEENYKKGHYLESHQEMFGQTYPGKIEKQLLKAQAQNRSHGQVERSQYVRDLLNKGISKEVAQKEASKMFGSLEQERTGVPFTTLEKLRVKIMDHKNALDPKKQARAYREATDLYDMVRGKIESHIEHHATPEQIKSYKESNAQYADYASREQSDMKHFVYDLTGTRNEQDAFRKLTKDPRYLEAASKYLDTDQKRDLLETLVATAGNRQGRFNIAHAHTELLKYPYEVRKKMASFFPTAKERENFVDALSWIGENKRNISKIANTSGSAHMGADILRSAAYLQSVSKVVGSPLGLSSFKSGVSEAVNLILQDLAVLGGGKLLTDKTYLDRIAKVRRADTVPSKINHIKLLLKAPEVKQVLAAAARSSLHDHPPYDHEEEEE